MSTPEEQTTTSEPRVFKNPTTIEELKEMRTQLQKDRNLKRRVKIEYKKKVQIETQGQIYQPPEDLKQFKILQPKNLDENHPQTVMLSMDPLNKGNDTSTKDISDQVFIGEEKE